jgi:hypothetical protein
MELWSVFVKNNNGVRFGIAPPPEFLEMLIVNWLGDSSWRTPLQLLLIIEHVWVFFPVLLYQVVILTQITNASAWITERILISLWYPRNSVRFTETVEMLDINWLHEAKSLKSHLASHIFRLFMEHEVL